VIISSALGNAKGFAAVEKFTAGVSFQRCAPPRSSSVTKSSLHYSPAYMRVQSSELDMFQIVDEYEAAIESSVNLFFVGGCFKSTRWLI
jgi:hypothetical protein